MTCLLCLLIERCRGDVSTLPTLISGCRPSANLPAALSEGRQPYRHRPLIAPSGSTAVDTQPLSAMKRRLTAMQRLLSLNHENPEAALLRVAVLGAI
jgi:hypothetical protein